MVEVDVGEAGDRNDRAPYRLVPVGQGAGDERQSKGLTVEGLSGVGVGVDEEGAAPVGAPDPVLDALATVRGDGLDRESGEGVGGGGIGRVTAEGAGRAAGGGRG
ncbi:hypothetical protein ABTX77_35785 [Streptomyces sp. NPDC097704]|uniref:hypothetical protein n=1 Tax=Streptomyces sp. NPDC097704 TaxID=3157101 RepID=UPI003329B86C